MTGPRAYYNEHDSYAAQWIRNLIAAGLVMPGDVDERSIVDVRPSDLAGYTRCHFFAGIAGWDYALGLAGWPDDRPVWTGSSPCQPFSEAGRCGGFNDERHLWPIWFKLIRECRPFEVFGEQVYSKGGLVWLDLVCSDLEGSGYTCGAIVAPGYTVGAPHKRDRIWIAANAAGDGREGLQRGAAAQVSEDRAPQALGAWDRPGDPFADWQKLLAGTEVRRLADGVSSYVEVRPALRAYGNAIVPQVAAAFVGAYLDGPLSPSPGSVETQTEGNRT